MLRAFWKRQPRDDAAKARAEALSAAKAKRNAAMAAYREAKAREDTRSIGDALRSLRHATTDVVRLELGR